MSQGERANRIGCAEFRRNLAMDRRGFVKAGALGLGGLSLANLMRAEAAVKNRDAVSNDKCVIILWKRGGDSQHETWDPNPDAPQEYRGSFGAMSTKVPGTQICDLLPQCAKMTDKFAILRSLHHKNAGHSAGDQILFTGYPPGRNPNENLYPSCGSIVAKQLGHLNPELPPSVMIPRHLPGVERAYLGKKYSPFYTQAAPANKATWPQNGGKFEVPNLELTNGLDFNRLDSRRGLLNGFDSIRRDIDNTGNAEAMDKFQQQALDIVTRPRARDAFNLDAEPMKLRERYGFMPQYNAPTPDRCGVPSWSQRILLARRLVEAGVRLVTVDLRWWDTHVEGMDSMKNGFLPRWDLCYSALIEDLDQRGLLDTTLVVAWGEFGRTPRVNKNNGRDHYPNVFSAALAGGPVKGGRVVGSSDSKGAFPLDNPKSPQDVLATIYQHLGIDTERHYIDHSGRPIITLPFGKPIEELA